ncbi:MAG TPA: SRPBCC family protein [Methylomirabilota bacterium]|nr:SRPBCC family protein [Methylomirabilota bacterium]
MLAKILVALAVVVAGLAVVIALQPSDFRVSRTTTIAAPAPVVFAQVNDFHNWTAWSPWAKLDPSMKQTYEGAPAGTGAIYTWVGNREVGEGRMTVVESRPSDLIRVKLDFVKPLAGTSVAEFTFRPEGDRTAVTWTMTGEKNFVAKAIHLVLSMDRMIGDQFEKGLAAMKTMAEAAPRSSSGRREGGRDAIGIRVSPVRRGGHARG